MLLAKGTPGLNGMVVIFASFMWRKTSAAYFPKTQKLSGGWPVTQTSSKHRHPDARWSAIIRP
jgi:hypothetical protein